jgi:hypothetical protein
MVSSLTSPIRLRPSASPAFTGNGLRTTALTPLKPAPSRQPAARAAHLLALQKEPEDARLTGGTRSLDRRLLALNLYGKAIKAKLLPPRPASTPLPCSTAA